MIATPNLDEIIGAEVVDPNNDAVGKVGRIYLDSDRDVPTWITVKTGLFGLAETLVPVDDATWEGNVLHVGVDKARIKDAPRVDVDQEIAPEDQQRLYRYYDRDPSSGAGETASGGYGTDTAGYEGGRHADRPDAGTAGIAASGAGGAGMASAGVGRGGHRSRGMDEPLGGGNHNPAAFEGDEVQRMRDAGRGSGDGQLGGGSQNPDVIEGRESFGGDAGELGGGNQNPALYERREDRSLDEGDLGGGNQNPGGFSGVAGHPGVGASTHGGPGEFSGPGAGLADASRRAAERDDPGRMRMTEGDAGDQGGLRHPGDTPTSSGNVSTGTSREQGVSSQGGDGRMRLRRYVVTEQQTVTMPVTREEYRLEPEEGDRSDDGR